ncbi:actin-1/3 [Plakobranchus ocellatus]|uniref:Actin-1/3 n=1 Tax=Plakobranchus ocellatus TaxID=259542 RepID=A0AAV3ZMF9_9GAST|nr:actin-1/3 [Plakobranchus ocellatus]
MIDLPDTYASVDTDMIAYELMRRHDIRGRLFLTPGDGKWLFNSISIILICNTQMASELRYKTCIQMATRKDRVLEGHRNIDDLFTVSPDYDESLIACARATEFFYPPGLFSVCLRYSNTMRSLFIHPRTGRVMRLCEF